MTNPMDALTSFQREHRKQRISINPATTDPELFLHFDQPQETGDLRYTYVRFRDYRVTALAMFVMDGVLEGEPYFSVGYAVPEGYRNQGRGKDVVKAGLRDMEAGLLRNGHKGFYIDAVVSVDNVASIRVAESIFAESPEPIEEALSGLPALKFFRHVIIGD